MKNFILFTIAWSCLSISSFAQTDDDAIKSTINTYFDGFTKGDSASLNKAFYSGALLRNLNTMKKVKQMHLLWMKLNKY